jgi:hypothetical protein
MTAVDNGVESMAGSTTGGAIADTWTRKEHNPSSDGQRRGGNIANTGEVFIDHSFNAFDNYRNPL